MTKAFLAFFLCGVLAQKGGGSAPCGLSEQKVTPWKSRDGPGGTGDWELYSLFNPPPCGASRYPISARCRRISDEKPSHLTGETVSCTTSGLVCLKSLNSGGCSDYEVGFTCCPFTPPTRSPTSLPSRVPSAPPTRCAGHYETAWISRMVPNPKTGDWEYYKTHKPCNLGFMRVDAQCRRISDQKPSHLTGQTFSEPCSVNGLVCLTADNQPGGCDDYEVKFTCCKATMAPSRYPTSLPTLNPSKSPTTLPSMVPSAVPTSQPIQLCPTATWTTSWLDRDNPGGDGDWELYNHFNPIHTCGLNGHSVAADCRRLSDQVPSHATGQVVVCTADGFVCLNNQNLPSGCDDYEVRFVCCANAMLGENTAIVSQASVLKIGSSNYVMVLLCIVIGIGGLFVWLRCRSSKRSTDEVTDEELTTSYGAIMDQD